MDTRLSLYQLHSIQTLSSFGRAGRDRAQLQDPFVTKQGLPVPTTTRVPLGVMLTLSASAGQFEPLDIHRLVGSSQRPSAAWSNDDRGVLQVLAPKQLSASEAPEVAQQRLSKLFKIMPDLLKYSNQLNTISFIGSLKIKA